MSITSSNYQIVLDAKINTATLQKQISALSKNTKLPNLAKIGAGATASIKPVSSLYSGLTKFNATVTTIRSLVQTMQSLTSAVYELDSAVIEYKKVSDLTESGMDSLIQKAGDLGKELGKTSAEFIESATEFRKSNFNDDDALILAQTASILSNVADGYLSASDSAEVLIANMKAFDIQAEDSLHIADAINSVSNNFALASSDISGALSKTSSAMGTLGNSFEETIGLVTAGTELLTGQA